MEGEERFMKMSVYMTVNGEMVSEKVMEHL